MFFMLPHLLLVDDDPLFCQLMELGARQMGFRITTCNSGRDFSQLPDLRFFDVAVVDHFFGDLKGEDVAPYFAEMPVILVSANRECLKDSPHWPKCIKFFVDKSSGIPTILKAAYESAGMHRAQLHPV